MDKQNKTLTYQDVIRLEIASVHEDIMQSIMTYLLENDAIRIGQHSFEIETIDVIPAPKLNPEGLTFKTISPITVYRSENKKVIYPEPEEPYFLENMHENLEKKYYLSFGFSMKERPLIHILNHKKRITHFKESFVLAYDMHLRIETNDPMLIRLLADTGLGAKNSMGFGMLKF